MKTSSESGWQKFLELCRNTSDTEQLNKFFDFAFTLEEKQTIGTRIELTEELLRGKKTQRVIARDLSVSIAKITRGSNALKTISPEIKQYLCEQLIESANVSPSVDSADNSESQDY